MFFFYYIKGFLILKIITSIKLPLTYFFLDDIRKCNLAKWEYGRGIWFNINFGFTN